jgi:hypothetical protein
MTIQLDLILSVLAAGNISGFLFVIFIDFWAAGLPKQVS